MHCTEGIATKCSARTTGHVKPSRNGDLFRCCGRRLDGDRPAPSTDDHDGHLLRSCWVLPACDHACDRACVCVCAHGEERVKGAHGEERVEGGGGAFGGSYAPRRRNIWSGNTTSPSLAESHCMGG